MSNREKFTEIFGTALIRWLSFSEAMSYTEMGVTSTAEKFGKLESGDQMKCKDCEYFHIRQEPLRTPGTLWDLGRAECQKYNLVVDFADHGKLDKLECYREGQSDERCGNCKYFCRLKHNFQVGRGFEDAYACFVMMHGKGWIQEVEPNEMCEMFVRKEDE